MLFQANLLASTDKSEIGIKGNKYQPKTLSWTLASGSQRQHSDRRLDGTWSS